MAIDMIFITPYQSAYFKSNRIFYNERFYLEKRVLVPNYFKSFDWFNGLEHN